MEHGMIRTSLPNFIIRKLW